MTSPERKRWFWAAVAAVISAAALAFLSVRTMSLARRAAETRESMAMAARQSLALRRIESWLLVELGPEAGRSPSAFQAYAEPELAYDTLFNPIPANRILIPSPLLMSPNPYFPFHVTISADGTMTSPQTPDGNERDLAEATGVDPAGMAEARRQLEAFRASTDYATLDTRLNAATTRIASMSAANNPLDGTERKVAIRRVPDGTPEEQADRTPGAAAGTSKSWAPNDPKASRAAEDAYQAKRAKTKAAGRGAVTRSLDNRSGKSWINEQRLADSEPATVGAFVPMWSGDDSDSSLVFVRRVIGENVTELNAVVGDWPRISETLESLVDDLIPGATIEPVRARNADVTERDLVLLPARLSIPKSASVAKAAIPAGLTTLIGGVWAAWALGFAAVAMTLAAANRESTRRARFAGAVSHELRTPLATFCLYSEMLAENLVPDPAKQQEYVSRLHRLSRRMAGLVDNVLAYARLDQGRASGAPRLEALGPLVERLAAQLGGRLEEAGLELIHAIEPAAAVCVVESDVVEHVVVNLLENARRYAANGDPPTVELSARAAAANTGRIDIIVRDHGPGIDQSDARRIFLPFERGNTTKRSESEKAGQAESTVGLGLGLALARDLARRGGGDLTLDAHGGTGAKFRLSLPGRAALRDGGK